MKHHSSFERARNEATRLFISIVGVSLTFVLGLTVAQLMRKSRDRQKEGTVDIVNRPADSVVISADPNDVYRVARQLEYFDRFLIGVDKFKLVNPSVAKLVVTEGGKEYALGLEVIADQPGEFFALRIEFNGGLYGTCAVRFESLPANNGTTVSVHTRYKVQLSEKAMSLIRPTVSREVDVYLHNLKRLCEQTLTERALGDGVIC